MKREGTCRAVTSTRPNESNSAAVSVEAWELRDDKAFGTIFLLVDDLQICHFRDKTTAKDAWEALKSYHEKASGINKFTLIVELLQLKFSEGDDMGNHIGKTQELIDNLTALRNKSAQEFGPWIILRSMLASYHTLVSVLASRPEDELTIDVVKATLLSEHKRRKNLSIEENYESAMRVNTNKINIECYFCHTFGHYKSECPQFIEWSKRRQRRERTRVVFEDDEQSDDKNDREPIPHYAYVVNSSKNPSNWFLDSAASGHTSNNIQFFSTFHRTHQQ